MRTSVGEAPREQGLCYRHWSLPTTSGVSGPTLAPTHPNFSEIYFLGEGKGEGN